MNLLKSVFESLFTVSFGAALSLHAAGVCAETPLTKVNISEVIRTPLLAALYVPVGQGFYKDEGLDVDIIAAGRRDLAMLSVLSGETDFNVIDPAEIAMARTKGGKTKVIAPIAVRLPIYLIAPEGNSLSEHPRSPG